MTSSIASRATAMLTPARSCGSSITDLRGKRLRRVGPAGAGGVMCVAAFSRSGLGIMGAAMMSNLHKAGYRVVLHDADDGFVVAAHPMVSTSAVPRPESAPSGSGEAAVDHHLGAAHVPGARTGQVHDRVGDIFRPPDPLRENRLRAHLRRPRLLICGHGSAASARSRDARRCCARHRVPTRPRSAATASRDVAGFVKVAKERAATKGLSFGTGNTSSLVAAELLKASAKIQMISVPYRGTPQALQDLVGGQIDMFFADPFAAAGFISAGTIKALAVTDTARVPLLPKVPTMTEAGFKDVHLVSWAATFVPARTDPAIVERLNKEINAVLARTQTREHLQKMGATPLPMSSAELRKFVNSEIARWAKLVEIAGIPKK